MESYIWVTSEGKCQMLVDMYVGWYVAENKIYVSKLDLLIAQKLKSWNTP